MFKRIHMFVWGDQRACAMLVRAMLCMFIFGLLYLLIIRPVFSSALLTPNTEVQLDHVNDTCVIFDDMLAVSLQISSRVQFYAPDGQFVFGSQIEGLTVPYELSPTPDGYLAVWSSKNQTALIIDEKGVLIRSEKIKDFSQYKNDSGAYTGSLGSGAPLLYYRLYPTDGGNQYISFGIIPVTIRHPCMTLMILAASLVMARILGSVKRGR